MRLRGFSRSSLSLPRSNAARSAPDGLGWTATLDPSRPCPGSCSRVKAVASVVSALCSLRQKNTNFTQVLARLQSAFDPIESLSFARLSSQPCADSIQGNESCFSPAYAWCVSASALCCIDSRLAYQRKALLQQHNYNASIELIESRLPVEAL